MAGVAVSHLLLTGGQPGPPFRTAGPVSSGVLWHGGPWCPLWKTPPDRQNATLPDGLAEALRDNKFGTAKSAPSTQTVPRQSVIGKPKLTSEAPS